METPCTLKRPKYHSNHYPKRPVKQPLNTHYSTPGILKSKIGSLACLDITLNVDVNHHPLQTLTVIYNVDQLRQSYQGNQRCSNALYVIHSNNPNEITVSMHTHISIKLSRFQVYTHKWITRSSNKYNNNNDIYPSTDDLNKLCLPFPLMFSTPFHLLFSVYRRFRNI